MYHGQIGAANAPWWFLYILNVTKVLEKIVNV